MSKKKLKMVWIVIGLLLFSNGFMGVNLKFIQRTNALKFLSITATPNHPNPNEQVFISATIDFEGSIVPTSCIFYDAWVVVFYKQISETDFVSKLMYQQSFEGGNVYVYNTSISSFPDPTVVEYYVQYGSEYIHQGTPGIPDGTICGGGQVNSPIQSFLVGLPPPIISSLSHFPKFPASINTVKVNSTFTDTSGSFLDKVIFNLYANDVFVSSSETTFAAGTSSFSGTVGQIAAYPSDTKIEYNITVFDNNGNVTNSETLMYFVDGTPPTITSLSHSLDPNYLSNTTITLVASDSTSGINKTKLYYRVDEETIFSMIKMIKTSVDTYEGVIPTLPVNSIVKYKANIMDNAGNEVNSTLQQFLVIDATYPQIIEFPNDLLIGITSSYNLEWNVSDATITQYEIRVNGTLVNSGEFTGNVILSSAINTTELGIFNYTLLLNDSYNNINLHTVYVTIVDYVTLTLNSPEDFSYEYSSQGNEIVWSVNDDSPVLYKLYVDDEILEENTWTSGQLAFTVDGLGIGLHNITLYLLDIANNFLADTVFVEVRDTTAPSITIESPTNKIYNEKSLTFIYSINEASTVTIYVDGVANKTSLESGTVINFINGVHNITIQGIDPSSNIGSEQVIFTVNVSSDNISDTSETSQDSTDNGVISETSQVPTNEKVTNGEIQDSTDDGANGFTIFISLIAIHVLILSRRIKIRKK